MERSSLRCVRPDERGISVTEIVLAVALLASLLGVVLSGFARTQTEAAFAASRQQALSELRTTADTFAKDARQAVAVTDVTGSRIVMTTYVGETERSVTYEVVAVEGELQLRRTQSGASPMAFVVDLADPDVFVPDSTDAADVRTIRLVLTTKPDARRSPVELLTEVALRNVR